MPGSKNEAPVTCTGCQGTNSSGQPNDGLKTYPYGNPIKDHVGRYVDSSSTASFQHIGFRTARARYIRTVPQQRGSAPPRIYIQIGNALGAYSLDSFFSQKLPGGMVSASNVKTGSKVGGVGRSPIEKILMWDGFIYPESKDSQWHCPFVDDQDPMGDGAPFDFDDRGNIYVAYTHFGWGIVKDDGRSDAAHFPTISQMISGGPVGAVVPRPLTGDDVSGVSPSSIVAVKVGSKYYTVTAGNQDKDAVWDVTVPASPRFLFKRDAREYGIRKFDRNDDAGHIAVVTGNKRLRVYTYESFISSASPTPIYDAAGPFADVSFDEQGNLWAAETGPKVWKLTPGGNSYTAVSYSPHTAKFDQLYVHAGAGHVVVAGADHGEGLAYNVKVFKVDASGLQPLDLDGFFTKYYHKAPANYAQPAGYNSIGVQADVQVVKSGGKTYLMYSSIGLGDVYEIQGEDSIDIKVKNNAFGTANPNSKGTAGPYVGDIVTFTAPSTNAQVVYDVTWDFANPESGTANQGLKKSNQEITHQYTGLNTAAKITATKQVKAITVQSANVSSQYALSLKVPTPRIGISGVATPITANTTGLKVVAGQTFNDASDGSNEGHYGNWTIGATTTKLKPNETIAVGEVGPQTLQFQAAYGKYDASFNGDAPYMTTPITVGYTVLPFRASINAPTASGTNVTFTGQPLVAPAPTVIAGTWAVTWTFNPGGTSASAVTTQTTSAPINTIPSFTVPKGDVVNGSVVTLKVEIEIAGLSLPAQAYAIATESMTLQAPDPVINRTGCTHEGGECTFTASSPTDPAMTGWTYAWTLTGPGGSTKTGSTKEWSPSLDAPGNYTVSLKATKSIFEKTVSQTLPTVEATLCGPLPDGTQVAISQSACKTTACAAGTTVRFSAAMFGYRKQDCDKFEWNFGSGEGTATGVEVEHKYNDAGTFTVSLKISQQGKSGSLTETSTVKIGGGSSGGGGNGGGTTCTAPTSAAITWTGCSAGGCRTTDNITFNAKRGTANLQSCDDVEWTFEGTSPPTSNQNTVVRKFTTPGTFKVTAVIKNEKGESPLAEANVTVTQAPSSGSCPDAPGPGNFAITYAGATSGCTNTNGIACQPNETINFTSLNYLYPPASCDHFEWNFADGSAKPTTRNAAHAYANSGVYHVEFTVSNGQGEYTYTRNVTVQGSTSGEPVPTLTATSFPSTGVKGRTVTFTATSNNPNTTGWTWNFGDSTSDSTQAGQTKQSSTVTHTFTKTGGFTVRVTARNAADVPTAPVGLAQGNITISDAPAIPEYRFLLPVAAHVGGQGGSQWRTDVQIYNADPNVGTEAAPLNMEALFNGVTYPLHQIKSTHIYEDIVGQLLNQQKDGQGPIIITTKNAMKAPMIWTRTYNQSINGTFGQFIPAIRIDNAGGAGAVAEGKYYLAGLRHDERNRTNLGFLNPNAATIIANITVFDDDHFAIHQFTRTLQPFQLDPVNNLKDLVPNLPVDRPFSLEITIPSGNWLVAYASFINNKSQDPVYLQAVRDSDVASPDFATAVIPGVGHTGPWRSDVTIFNPDSQGLEFTLQYYDKNGAKLAETPGIRIDPRKFIQYDDILTQGVLGGSVTNGIGTLKIINTSINGSAMLQPMAFARTYNDDGANGTFGQGIPAFAAARPNVTATKQALIAGVRNNEDYYTNIGLLNLAATPVTAKVSLLDPVTGNSIATINYELAPNQSIVGAYNGFGAVTSGTLKIEANGNVWAFCSIVDRQTFDPEYVSAVTLP